MQRRNFLHAGLTASAAALTGSAWQRPMLAAQNPDFLRLPERFRPERVLNSFAPKPATKYTLAELEGPGCIRQVWFTVRPYAMANRNVVLRIFWDGEEKPSVETPLGDFFGLCHGIGYHPINSLHLSV